MLVRARPPHVPRAHRRGLGDTPPCRERTLELGYPCGRLARAATRPRRTQGCAGPRLPHPRLAQRCRLARRVEAPVCARHCARATGHAQDMIRQGASLTELLRAGEWRSASFMRYIDETELEREVFSPRGVPRQIRAPAVDQRQSWKRISTNRRATRMGPSRHHTPRSVDRACARHCAARHCVPASTGVCACMPTSPALVRLAACAARAVSPQLCSRPVIGLWHHDWCLTAPRRAQRPSDPIGRLEAARRGSAPSGADTQR